MPARLASDEPKPVAVAVAPTKAPARADAADVERAAPSWMPATRVPGIGKRALYGVIAGTCALIGIAALVVQFATRPPARVGAPPPTTSTPLVRTQPAAPVPVPTVAPATAAVPTSAPITSTTMSTAMTSATTTSAAPTTASARAPVTAAPHAAATATATKARTTSVAAIPAAPNIAATLLEREARCTEILQKASLEKITSAETDFFKRECK